MQDEGAQVHMPRLDAVTDKGGGGGKLNGGLGDIVFRVGADLVREVIAFPKIGGGYDPMMDAPSIIDGAQWSELGLELKAKPSA